MSLTLAQALVLVEREHGLYLPNLMSLSPDVADVLSRHEGPFLDLDGLTSICQKVAKSLATFEGELSLTGLTEISLEVGASLASKRGGRIYLPKNFCGSVAGAKAIVAEKGKWVAAENIDQIEAALAAALAQSERVLSLSRLTTISHEVAKALGDRKGELLCLDGLTELSPDMAELLAGRPGHLSIDGLTALAPMVAHSLSRHRSRCIFLCADEDWCDAHGQDLFDDSDWFIERSLSRLGVTGRPRHDSIRFLTRRLVGFLAESLQQKKGISFDPPPVFVPPQLDDLITACVDVLDKIGPQSFSSDTPYVYLQCDYDLYLNGVVELSVDDAESLARHSGDLFLAAIKSLPTVSLAAKLARTDNKDLYLNGLEDLPPDIAAELATYSGEKLHLNGLRELSATCGQHLAHFRGRSLCLGGVAALSQDAATALSEFGGSELILDGLQQVSGEVAQALARFSGRQLSLRGVAALPPLAASNLAKFAGETLCLDGVTSLTQDAAAGLACFKGQKLFLSGIPYLPPEIAQELAAFAGSQMYLDGLREITRETARLLARYGGAFICLRGIAELSLESAGEFEAFNGTVHTRDYTYSSRG